MENRTATLLAIGVAGTGLVIGLLLSRSGDKPAVDEARAAAVAPTSRAHTVEQEPPVLERPDSRAPMLTESPNAPEPPIQKTSSPYAPPVPVASQHEALGDPTTWPTEYANKPIADLIADEARLNQEFKQDIDAEFEKRFQDGRNKSYAPGSEPTNAQTWGMQRGRRDGDSYKVVDLDPRVEPDLFVKQNKATWLHGEIANRQR